MPTWHRGPDSSDANYPPPPKKKLAGGPLVGGGGPGGWLGGALGGAISGVHAPKNKRWSITGLPPLARRLTIPSP